EGITSICNVVAPTLISLHATGGNDMIRKAREAVDKIVPKNRPKLLGITVLTSFQEKDLASIGVRESVSEQVKRLARLAVAAGADALRSPYAQLLELRFAMKTKDGMLSELVSEAARRKIHAKGVSDRDLEKWTGTDKHQNVAARVELRTFDSTKSWLEQQRSV